MKIPTLAAVAAAALVTLSACGSGSSGTEEQQPAAATGGGARLGVAQTALGKVLVDGQGMTLYVLSADGHDHSTCSTQCLQFWPAASPGRAGDVSVATGRTVTPDGTAIATVAGHPVYTFSLDRQPGDVTGEGVQEFGGTWYAVSPTGEAVTGAASSPSSPGSASSSGRGYAY